MGILQGLERRLRGAVDTTFARIFGGSVQPAEVTAALQHEAAIRVTHQDGRAIAPNRFTVELGPSDSAHVGDDVRRVSAALGAAMGEYVREQGWETFADVQVTLRESGRLHTGQFRISSLIDPGVSGQQTSNRYDAPLAGSPAVRGEPPAGQYLSEYPPGAYPPGTYPPPAYPPQAHPQNPNPYPPNQGAPTYGEPTWDPYARPAEQYPRPAEQYPRQSDPYAGSAYPYAPPDNSPHPVPPDMDPQPKLVVGDGTGRAYPLRRGSNVVGRGQEAALRLADTAVSREHIDVYFDGRISIVHDLGSTNGTTVNGSVIQTWQLADGDVIRLGTSTVVYSAR